LHSTSSRRPSRLAHNNEAGGSHGSGFTRPANLNSEEAKILVQPAWHLPHGSTDGYAVAPIPPEGPAPDEYIEQRWEALPLVQRDLPEWAPTRAIWLPILQNEREVELSRYFGPYNVSGHRAYWRRRDIDTVLWEHGYRPGYRAMSPAHGPARPALHPRQRGRRRGTAPRKASPQRAPPRILHYRTVPPVSPSGRAALGLLRCRRV
jgi:hypothetical protein